MEGSIDDGEMLNSADERERERKIAKLRELIEAIELGKGMFTLIKVRQGAGYDIADNGKSYRENLMDFVAKDVVDQEDAHNAIIDGYHNPSQGGKCNLF